VIKLGLGEDGRVTEVVLHGFNTSAFLSDVSLAQDHLLPSEYVTVMRDNLLDKCPVSPWSEVRAIMKEDFGMFPEEMYHSIEETPIASASLAQVRRSLRMCTACEAATLACDQSSVRRLEQ
jgi:hypothetical protein